MSFFKGWSFSRKLFAVNSAYILPCAVLGYFLTADQGEQIDFSHREKVGVEFQRPLQSMLSNASLYKVLVHRHLHGHPDLKERIALASNQVERALITLASFPDHEFVELKYTHSALALQNLDRSSVESLKSEWQSIAAQLSTASPTAHEESINRFIASVRQAISYIGDSSNLSLDSHLDSKYTANVVTLALPQAQDRLQQLMSFAVSLAPGDSWTQERRTQLQVLAALLKADADAVVSQTETAIREDKHFAGSSESFQRDIPLALKDFTTATQTVIRDALAAADAQDPTAMLLDLVETGERSLDNNFAFWNKFSGELESLIDLRIKEEREARVLDLLLAALAWIPVIVIATLTVRRLSQTFIAYAEKLESEAELANNSSVELASASQTVSAGSTEQAAAIQETGASMSEITSMVARSSTQAISSQDLARKVKDQTEEGCQVIERLVLSMEAIQAANGQLQNISNIISAISEKTNIINDIVGKTQLLSFNASIEAARAGQHGRGFAVVAEEVGNLAQTSGNAAKEIRNLIDDSRQQVQSILNGTVERVSEGRAVTGQAQEIFTKIAKDISTISSQIESISEASREQQFGIEQIAKAMTQMDQGTQINNSAAFSAARLSDQLLSQSRKLTGIARTIGELVAGARERPPHLEPTDALAPTKGEPAKRKTLQIRLKPGPESNTMDQTKIDATVNSLAAKESELDRATPSGAKMDPNDPSFKKVA